MMLVGFGEMKREGKSSTKSYTKGSHTGWLPALVGAESEKDSDLESPPGLGE